MFYVEIEDLRYYQIGNIVYQPTFFMGYKWDMW